MSLGLGANDGIRDDPDVNPSTLRFGVGNLVMYKGEGADGWFEGEVVKVSQRLTLGPHSKYIAYIVWPHREMADEDLGTEWVLEDTDEHIKPRMDDKTPDPSKFKPLLVSPKDPYHFLYTDFKLDDVDVDGEDRPMVEALRSMNIDASANPDGSATVQMQNGKEFTTMIQQVPQEPIRGVEGIVVFMFSSKLVNVRRPVHFEWNRDPVETFKSILPTETSLTDLEQKAQTSPRKMLQLADSLMLGITGFPKDAHRACNLYRAAAWGCTEEEEATRVGIPNGIPEAMIAAAMINVTFFEKSLGYDMMDNVPFKEWLSEGLRSERGRIGLHQIFQVFYWVTEAVRLHGWVTPLTLLLANTVKDMNFASDPRLAQSDVGGDIRRMCDTLACASDYREEEMRFEKRQKKGEFPRGEPSNETLRIFSPKALGIFQSLPMSGESMHVEFKQVPRSPFPMVALAFFPSKRMIQKIVRLPESMQMTPFSLESFEYVWVRLAFDIHLGMLRTNKRVRPAKFTIPGTHGNKTFASYLSDVLNGSDTKVKLVSHSDSIKTGRRSRSTYGELVSEVIALFLDIPGVLIDSDHDSLHDIIARAQEDYVDRIIDQGIENEDDGVHRREASQRKARGNHYFQHQDFSAAMRCYSIALGHMRRIVEHDQESHKLLGTLLSNRAACYLSLIEGQHSLEFRKVLARNAINDCTAALDSSWSSTSLPDSILEKLRFRRDKATASYDSLSAEYSSVSDILFPATAPPASARTMPAADSTESPRQSRSDRGQKNSKDGDDAVAEYGEVLYENGLSKNAKDGCPICLRDFSGELAKEYSIVLPCGEHAVCASCACSLKIESDKAKQWPSCPLCRHAFDPEFIEGIPAQIIQKDQEIANLIIKLPDMDLDDKVAVAERLMWTHRFEVSAVVDAIESLLDGKASGLFFRSKGDLTHQQKENVYRQARLPVEKLEKQVQLLLQEQRETVDDKALEELCKKLRGVRSDLRLAREKAREEIYSRMNTVGSMGAELAGDDGAMVQVDYHGLHVNEMRKKFKEHVLPILPVVGKLMVITGRGAHSVGKESKLKKAIFKLIGEYETVYWQQVDKNPGALYVLWRKSKK